MPLTPLTPEFALRTLTMPLDVAVPSPEAMSTLPPVLTVLRPAWADSRPPAPLVPLPTAISTDPLRPSVAAPVPSTMAPELPELDGAGAEHQHAAASGRAGVGGPDAHNA